MRAGEIVLGRILGFTIVGTVLLAIMACSATCSSCGRSTTRTRSRSRGSKTSSMPRARSIGKTAARRSTTTIATKSTSTPTATATPSRRNEHEHSIANVGTAEQPRTTSPAREGYLRARVPQYGKLRFLDRRGAPAPRGISVGSEWTYRSFIEGGSAAAAVWTFSGINESVLRTNDDGQKYLPLELIVRVFRTYKGDIEQGIQGSIRLRNPDNRT